ncbi:hypothetical protein F5Y19DRAFT_367735 [Xylariaceae sp. FL1651]|nr:hypothetical protein F5Y19DRAFT_367735 [Xylariaceae sp. FL1651]
MGLFKSASNAGRSRPDQPTPSNIRGKISGPIPIDDDEFPIRNPGSSIALEGEPKQLESVPQRDSAATSTNTALNVTREEKTDSVAQSGPSQASTTSTPQRRRTNRSSALRYSTVSEATDAEPSSRKKSSLRLAIGKLFGRNKKKGSRSASDSEAQVEPSEDHHRSDPPVVKRERPDIEGEPKRSASLPITEFNKALRSHSIGPDDFIAIHSARNSIQTDSAFLRRRAVTTSGRVFNSRSRDQSVDVIGLTPRPASAQGHSAVDEQDSEAIGCAVSTDLLASHRRSRSLSQLADVADEQGHVRNRSEEIRFWRESYNPVPLSPDLSISNQGGPEMTEFSPDTHREAQPTTPPQPFTFGPMVNMKITQAVSLEDRVAALEAQNQKLERLVSQLFQVVPGVSNYPGATNHPLPAAPMVLSATYAATSSATANSPTPHVTEPSSSRYSMSRQSNESFEDGKTFIGSIPPSTAAAPRPLSNATIRGATSLPSLPRDISGTFTPDHYTTLKALLDAERAARQTLEIRVTKLTHMVDMMSRTTHKLDTNSSAVYANVSTFEHDDDEDDGEPLSASIDDSSDAFKTPREEKPAHDFDAFGEGLPDEVDEGSRKKAARTLSLGQLTLGKPKHSQQPDAGVNL